MSSLQQAAIELNNAGVFLHKCSQHRAANHYFMDALRAMKSFAYSETLEHNRQGSNRGSVRWAESHRRSSESSPNFQVTASGNRDEKNIGTVHGFPVSLHEPITINTTGNKKGGDVSMDCKQLSSIILFNVGIVKFYLNSLEESVMLLHLSASTLRDQQDSMSNAIYMCIHSTLGLIQHKIGDNDAAGKSLLKSLQIGVDAFGRKDTLVASSLFLIGQFLIAQGNIHEALMAFHEAKSIHDALLLQRVTDAFSQEDKTNFAAHAA